MLAWRVREANPWAEDGLVLQPDKAGLGVNPRRVMERRRRPGTVAEEWAGISKVSDQRRIIGKAVY